MTEQERWGQKKEEDIERCVHTRGGVFVCVCVCVGEKEALWSEVFEEERLFSVY